MDNEELFTVSHIISNKVAEITKLQKKLEDIESAFNIWFRQSGPNKEFEALVQIKKILGIP